MRRGKRSGFTLVEMLVVITLILVLAALAAAFMPRLSQDVRITDAANTVQGWLIGAQVRAARDKVATGIRFYADDPANPTTVSTAQLIQQPDVIAGGQTVWAPLVPGTSPPATIGGQPFPVSAYQYPASGGSYYLGALLVQAQKGLVSFQGVDFSLGGLPQSQWLVQPGDSLEVFDGGVYTIASIPQVGPPANQVQLGTSFYDTQLSISTPTTGFRIQRQPRPLVGEPVMNLPANTVIDLQAMQQYGMVLPQRVAGAYDILFAPSGGCISGSVGQYILWVRGSDVVISQTNTDGQALVICKISGGATYVRDVAAGARPFQNAQQ